MNVETRMLRLLELEKQYGLYERRYRGVHYWHLIRWWVLGCADGYAFESEAPFAQGTEARQRAKVRGILRDCMNCLGQFPLKKTDVLLSVSKADQRMEDGEYFDPWSRFLALPTGMVLRVLESGADYDRPATEGCVSCCYFDLARAGHYYCIKKNFTHFADATEDSYLEALSGMLEKELGYSISPDSLKMRVRYSVASFSVYYAGIKKYLRKMRPRLVMMVCAYSLNHFAMTYAARELGIPTVELQHGNILRHDVAYHFTEEEGSRRYFPDYVFTFGEFWNRQTRLPTGCRAYAVGNLLTEYYRKRLSSVEQNARGIVVYSNGTQTLADIACALADMARTQGYTVTFKYHPAQLVQEKKRYPQLSMHGVLVEDTAVSVYEYLAANRHHVGGITTCLAEAMTFGGYGYMLKLPYYESYEALADAGCIYFFESTEALFAAIRQNDGTPMDDPTLVESVWRHDAVHHTINAMKTVMNLCPEDRVE